MERIIDGIGILALCILCWQDFRWRRISWWLLVTLVGVFLMGSIQENSASEIGKQFSLNIVFLCMQFLFVWIWFSIRNKKPARIIDTQIGLGDVLFLVCIALAFSPANFLMFYILGLIITLAATIIVRIFRTEMKSEIPLAGALAIPLIVLLCMRIIDPSNNYYSDHWLNSIIDSYA